MRILFLLALTTSLFACKQESSLPDPLEAGWNGVAVCELMEENHELRILKCTFPPGVGHERHYHAPHFIYAIQGSRFRLTDTTGVREVDFPSGGYYYSDGTPWHEALNIGDSTAVFLVMEPK